MVKIVEGCDAIEARTFEFLALVALLTGLAVLREAGGVDECDGSWKMVIVVDDEC